MRTYDLIVIGGGLVGSAIAWGAARRGARVALLDEGDVAYRAARGNFGLVWVQTKGAGFPPYSHWTRRSAALWPELSGTLAGTVGVEPALRQAGGFMFCLSDEEFERRAALLATMDQESGSIGTRMIDGAEVRAMVPEVSDRVVGAAYCPVDGHANPLKLLRGLHAGLAAMGADYLPNQIVDAITPQPGSFTVAAGEARFAAPRLVIAAGLGSRRLAPMVGLDMPVSPLKGEVIVTERLRPFMDYACTGMRQTEEGTVMLGDSQEDTGFETSVTVPVLRDIAARNLAVFPMLRDATVVRVWAALRVMSPDGFPIYEQSPAYPGAFAATCHSGVTLAGAHALALAPAILAGELPGSFDAFSAQRFRLPAD